MNLEHFELLSGDGLMSVVWLRHECHAMLASTVSVVDLSSSHLLASFLLGVFAYTHADAV